MIKDITAAFVRSTGIHNKFHGKGFIKCKTILKNPRHKILRSIWMMKSPTPSSDVLWRFPTYGIVCMYAYMIVNKVIYKKWSIPCQKICFLWSGSKQSETSFGHHHHHVCSFLRFLSIILTGILTIISSSVPTTRFINVCIHVCFFQDCSCLNAFLRAKTVPKSSVRNDIAAVGFNILRSHFTLWQQREMWSWFPRPNKVVRHHRSAES